MSRRRLSLQQWRDLIHQQQASGSGVQAFCRRRGLAVSTFHAKRRALQPKPSMHEPAPSVTFVEVKPTATDGVDEQRRIACDEETATSSSRGGDPIEIVLDRGIVVRVRAGFDAALLRRVVEVLA